VLYLASIAFLVVALARPSMTLQVPREQATVMLTMDVSRSMTATDVDPTRLAAAKAAAASFVDSLPAAFRIGLVAFSTDARLVVKPTTDRRDVREAIDDLRADGGTALGDAIAISLDATADARTASADADTADPSASPSGSPDVTPEATAAPSASADPSAGDGTPVTATILLSDGANSTGTREPLDAARNAATEGMPIYTIALGTADGVVEVEDELGRVQQLQVPPDTDTLKQVAEVTRGKYFDAPTAEDLAAVYESLGSKVGWISQEQEITQWFAAAALLLVVAGGGLAALWFNRFP
ncbi:MAG TPA: VWA domain-containing protein, partial [Candidatus Limnocylindrales bacterium]|nr:VWA domain-containing protein [Candidatus Limnocylindrales bacterium]